MTSPQNKTDTEEHPTQSTTNVSHATYPLPQPLVERLEVAMRSETTLIDSLSDALSHLIGNAVEAMDAMYFATPANIRKHPAFQHRLCLRITANPTEQTLSVTDMGAGMTRTDLINSLGIGRAGLISSTAKNIKSAALEDDSSTSADDDEDPSDESSVATNGEENDQNDKEETKSDSDVSSPMEEEPAEAATALDCRSKCLGGFYAAFCSLGTGVRVCTKAKFDDYYVFEVGMDRAPEQEGYWDSLKKFNLIRPFEEGTSPTAENGFNQFQHVRGESGTCVTIRLNKNALDSGYLDEEKLKPVLLKIVETTQYTVAFSSDENAQEIIDASAKEVEAIATLHDQEDTELTSLEAGAEQLEIRSTNDRFSSGSHSSVKERSKYIPLRLSLGERKMLRLVEAAMNCCDYTSEVDRSFSSGARRTHAQLKGVTSVLRGLVTACDYTAGQKLIEAENYSDYEPFFRQMFEIARRHKIMNPEKMRTEYGKLIYLLQDAVSPTVMPHLGFSVKGPIESVYKFLEERGGLGLLSDELIETATIEILALGRPRSVIDTEIRKKERAVNLLKRKYQTSRLSQDDIHLCLYSICDNNSFLNSNRVPIDKIIDFLKSNFSPNKIEEGYSLSIVSGEAGSRLSHSHERQFYYALQSLTLWRDIIDDMFRLWAMAEEDLLSESVTYSLQDTGQGMQRVQQSPRAYKAMQEVLNRVRNNVGHWVGSSVVHMGDHNVPNALSFIDKYTQVPRILGPIISCLENLERICKDDEGILSMINTGFGGVEKLRKDILYDFFRSAFDGSGSDLWYDAGSCVDGRLTSAWNWCSQLQEKPFYPIFKLTGFTGFDGDFK
ncbi:hypothetical protein FisN_4Hh168 [Fistulifera solaris]|uniref:Non-canonical E2 ubiquitin-conjugating enzyme C-terminal domain-containing protein n=1 Tax=Fistulifera solaris TaxID=1519565 RepID=A0A1Z5K8W5_FISSO|nr:hypothetical protein FisN_4Hh168 [Fistulifera solaris]|eukprot:GAX22720.1 hypothetical protein FisN_4Hh168 [Fistulifera solaris]